MRSKSLPILLGVVLIALIAFGLLIQNAKKAEMESSTAPTTEVQASPSPTGEASPSVVVSPDPNASPTPVKEADLTVDANGLSKATVVMTTDKGVIKFKFYPQDAPNTVNRIVELINTGFYNGLTFHRVVPGFVIQGGDPVGNGSGGSGQKLKAEFNSRRHLEGAVAMARAADPDSADSQFYISLGTHPHLDRNYTVFGQVIEGMDVAKRIQVGDRMTSVRIE